MKKALVLIMAAILLVGCNLAPDQPTATPSATETLIPSSTPTITRTPTITLTPTSTATATRTPTPTITPTPVPALVVFDSVELNLLGRSVLFRIATEEGKYDIRPIWSLWDVSTLKINPKLDDPSAKFTKMMTVLLWLVSEAGWNGVAYDEFVANSDAYLIRSLPDTENFHLSDITGVDYVILDESDTRRVRDRGIYGKYGFHLSEDGVLTIYSTTPMLVVTSNDWRWDSIYVPYKGKGLEQGLAEYIAHLPFHFFAQSKEHSIKSIQTYMAMFGHPYNIGQGSSLSWLFAKYEKDALWFAELDD